MAAGVFGYMGYDMVRLMEDLPATHDDPVGVPDGMLDLTLKFNTPDLIAALGSLSDGQCLVVHATGMTYDGRSFEGEDVIIIRMKKM